jgi:tetratricopeptide (TPR) repeat protein
MTVPTNSAPPAAGPSRRRRIAYVVITVLVVTLAAGLWLRWRRSQPEPPLPDLAGADPEVVELVQAARDEVLRARSSGAAWGRLGKVLYAHDFNTQAIRCFEQAESLEPDEPAWPYLQGMILVAEDPDASIASFKRAVERQPTDPAAARLELAEALLLFNRLDEAQFQLEQALQLEPTSLRARLGLGQLAMLRRDWRAALEQLEACMEDPRTRKQALTLRAQAWDQLGEAKKARAEQARAAELPADAPWPDPYYSQIEKVRGGLRGRLMRVELLIEANQLQDAIDLLRQTLDRYPESLDAWLQLGQLCYFLNRMDLAEKAYQETVRIAPEAAEGWFGLGCVQAVIHPREAPPSLRRAIRLKPTHARAHFQLAQCLQAQGDRDGAAEEYRATLQCQPDHEPARKALRELETPPRKQP